MGRRPQEEGYTAKYPAYRDGVRPWVDRALVGVIGLLIAIMLTLVSWAYSSTNGRIDKLEAAAEKLEATAAARSERITALDVSVKAAVEILMDLRGEIKEIKSEIRQLREKKP